MKEYQQIHSITFQDQGNKEAAVPQESDFAILSFSSFFRQKSPIR